MRAVLVEKLGKIEDLIIGDHVLREMSEDEVLIKVAYAGVNFPDILIAQGRYQFQPDLPFSPGGEVAGVVLKVGNNVNHLSVGDRVVAGTGWGGFAEEAIALGSNTFKLPNEVTNESAAATLMTFGTVIHALKDRAQLGKGESLAVLGAAGGVGSAAIQVGKVMGATVIACAFGEEKLKYCAELGADFTLDYAKEKINEKLKELTGGKGVDVIFDPVGADLSEPSFRAIARGGRHLVVGFAAGQVPAIPWNLPLLKSASIVGVFWGGFFRNEPEANARNILLLLDWLKEGKVQPTIDAVMSLNDVKDALQKLVNRDVKGKLLLRP